MEADSANSKKDFRHKISLCKKEAKETMHWLKMITAATEDSGKETEYLLKEADELNRIFSSIINKGRKTD